MRNGQSEGVINLVFCACAVALCNVRRELTGRNFVGGKLQITLS